jgi:hypothetical protein
MDAIDEMYVVDLGWPWTSDKAYTMCRWCNAGGVFTTLTEKRMPVHDICMKEIKGE